jgi:hypothetical protein
MVEDLIVFGRKRRRTGHDWTQIDFELRKYRICCSSKKRRKKRDRRVFTQPTAYKETIATAKASARTQPISS